MLLVTKIKRLPSVLGGQVVLEVQGVRGLPENSVG